MKYEKQAVARQCPPTELKRHKHLLKPTSLTPQNNLAIAECDREPIYPEVEKREETH